MRHVSWWSSKRPASIVTIWALLAVVTPAREPALAGTALDVGQAEIRLRVRYVLDGPPGFDVELMAREVDRIWSAHGVRIEWRRGDHIASADEPAHLVVGDTSALGVSGADDAALATLHRMRHPYSRGASTGRPDAMIVVSFESARTLADAAFAGESTMAAREVRTRSRLPVLVGRAVAHEIGHYLLESAGHSTHGLMVSGYAQPDVRWDRDYLVDAGSLARIRTLWHARGGVAQVATAAPSGGVPER